MELLSYALTVFVGVSIGLLGAGGAVLVLPILVYLLHIEPALATGYSLFIVGVSSAVAAFQYARIRQVVYSAAAILGSGALVGVYCMRRFFLPLVPNTLYFNSDLFISKSTLIMLTFSVVMIIVALNMLRKKNLNREQSTEYSTFHPIKFISSFCIGCLAGFVGASGGFLLIPALVSFFKLPMKKAVGTSVTIITVNSLIGFLGDVQTQSYIDWFLLLRLSFISVLGIFIGLFFSQKIAADKLKVYFSYFVLAMGVVILSRQFI